QIVPGTLAVRIGFRRVMTEEIDVERHAGQMPELRDRVGGKLRPHGRAADRAEATGVGDRGSEVERGNSRHRRLHDRVLDLEQLNETLVGPHSRVSYQRPAEAPPST